MKILYAAIDQRVPGTTGGSIHVAAVAEGLAALGHEVHALVTPGTGDPRASAVHWTAVPAPFGSPHLRLARATSIARLVRALRPDVIVERYHNFGGEAILAAAAAGALAVLEVNAPVIDYPGSWKGTLDRALLVEPMRRWRERIVRRADLIVTPSAAILPAATPRERILELEWGADTDRFRPRAGAAVPYARPPVEMLAAFAGAFRSWHGAIHLVHAVRDLHARGIRRVGAVLIGDGPELPRVRAAAEGVPGILFTGALPHEAMPAALAGADAGVAPFDPGAHAPLALGFYWSPLKLFEYMAAGLPVVAPSIDRLPRLVAHEREGLLYDRGRPGALAEALARLVDPALRRTLGGAARERAERDYSWGAHCRALDAAFQRARGVASTP
ncbi:MAG TPA: glycosyltransferase family 4 protein [Vicinamibacterales bacterium]|nr:glycosyltransferase family 4 protein [Vicinamibacterales bacterium]